MVERSRREISELERILAADPDDLQAWQRWLATKARIEGPDALLDPLARLEDWQAAPPRLQDAVVAEVGRRLGEAFEAIDIRRWSCINRRQRLCLRKVGDAMRAVQEEVEELKSARLGRFRHLETGMELMLVPGERAIAPFLIGRWPVTAPPKSPEGRPMRFETWSAAAQTLRAWGLRLPSGREWRHACSAGTRTRYYWGDEFDSSYAWHAGNSELLLRSCLEHERAERWNAFGLVDMIGLVWEWTDTPFDQGGFLDEARIEGEVSFATLRGSPAPRVTEGETVGVSARAAASVPRISEDACAGR